jgi:membrane fusion protein (multidrug efflux system)
MYVPDKEWQQVVLDYLGKFQAVVLQPAQTNGVRWEIEQVFSRVPRHQILLSMVNFKNRPNLYEEFRSWMLRTHHVALPLSLPFQDMPACIYFEAAGTVQAQPICYRSPLLWSLVGNAVDGRKTFNPFIRGLHGGLREPPNRPRKSPLQAALSIPVAVATVVGFIALLRAIQAIAEPHTMIPRPHAMIARVIRTVIMALNTISTNDAYVNGHVTFVAPRVAGQVVEVLVDDNYRVKRGDVLVRLDREPYQVQLSIRQAAVDTAKADLIAAEAQFRGQVAQAHANRYKMEHSMEDVKTQIANLRALVATLQSKKATLKLDEANLERGKALRSSGGISKEDLDQRQQAVEVDKATVEQALEQVYALRTGLGLPAKPEKGDDPKYLAEVPADLDQTFSQVQSSLSTLLQSAAQFGYVPTSFDLTPKSAFEEFYELDPSRNLDVIIAKLMPKAPVIQQAKAKLEQAQSYLAQAKLNLRYCDIVSEIDGVVTRRNINPGNNVAVGQNLMAIRSLKEIWIDANFKETQLADLRIGQRVQCEVDMYGSRQEYEGRITGFTMGTGQTLALLPPQNATGNFVKIVQRLPVRIEFPDYDPERDPPLFAGSSVVPYVYYKEPPDDKIPNAGKRLQSYYSLPQGQTAPSPPLPTLSPPLGPTVTKP